jgi:hypothetical protein
MEIKKIIDIVMSAFNMPSTPLTPLPPPLLLSGGNSRSGLSARNIASRIISRQSEAGAPVGAMIDGSKNISEAMEVIRIEEIVNALITEAKIEIIVPPGVPIVGVGGNAGGPVVVQGATTSYGQGAGVIR